MVLEALNTFRILCILLLYIFFADSSIAQEAWKLSSDKENIKVYTRKLIGDKFEQVKITTVIKSGLSDIVAILEDVPGQKNWMYATQKSELLGSKSSEDDFNYYLIMDMPFPAKDRDVVIHYERDQNLETKVVTTKSSALNGIKEEVKKLARITDFSSTYTLTPIGDKQVEVEYFLKANPGGSLPAWMVNLFTTKGPYESMLALVKLAESGNYKASVSTIID